MKSIDDILNDIDERLDKHERYLDEINGYILTYRTPYDLIVLSCDWFIEVAHIDELNWFKTQIKMLKEVEKNENLE